jgi:hypothetical protein
MLFDIIYLLSNFSKDFGLPTFLKGHTKEPSEEPGSILDLDLNGGFITVDMLKKKPKKRNSPFRAGL